MEEITHTEILYGFTTDTGKQLKYDKSFSNYF